MSLQGRGGGGCPTTQQQEASKVKGRCHFGHSHKISCIALWQSTEWYTEKEEKWKKKLSDLAQGLGQSAPPEWMPLPDEGEISGRAADSRVEVPKQTSERVTRERVPQIITKDWTKANRDRANEVTLQLEPHAMHTLNYSEHGR